MVGIEAPKMGILPVDFQGFPMIISYGFIVAKLCI